MRHCPVAVHEATDLVWGGNRRKTRGQGHVYPYSINRQDVERLADCVAVVEQPNQAVQMTPSSVSTCQVEDRSRVVVQMRLQMYHIKAVF